MATFAPSVARRCAIAAPIPREPPVTSATLLANLDIKSPLIFLRPIPYSAELLLEPLDLLSDEPVVQADLALWGIPAIPNRNAWRRRGNLHGSEFFTPGERIDNSSESIHSIEEYGDRCGQIGCNADVRPS